jgi:hypothetical protein
LRVLSQPEEFGERVLAEALRDAAGAAVQEGLRQLARPPASLRAAATRCVHCCCDFALHCA